ncbi:MAG: site-specific DNA-methyltransferase [Phycisphaeraceae bacterium]|nr:site-specific DNA-methyltransferase [Phycisphaeraceae bacterium]MCB9847821.1 site-specific DNA-methyltransferase [Phycisphaeraceae bacterium]
MAKKKTTTRSARAPQADTKAPTPRHKLTAPETRVYVGDCRELLRQVPDCKAGKVDLIFADPPFNWQVKYDEWHDGMPREEFLDFTYNWLDGCIDALTARGSLWVNIPDDTAAEIVVHLKKRGMTMVNWCIWHFRFGQNRMGSFIMSKVHALYFVKDPANRTWNAEEILEPSDRATTYFDPRTHNKREGHNGLRVPMDVWYGKYWGRIQGNNKERRSNHENQLPEVYLERVIRACSNEGDLVMDPFLGSGTTGVVARALNRRMIGLEYSAANAGSAFERIKAGPIRVGQGAINQSTAIFAPRRLGVKSRQGAGSG